MELTDKQLYNKHVVTSPLAAQTKSRAWPGVGTEKFPRFAAYGMGAYLFDRAGERYIDLAGANAAVPLGYGDTRVSDAVRGVLQSPTLSLPTELEYEASRAMLDAVPGADGVRWVKTGSEAVQAAILSAQATTGRDTVYRMVGSYHGWHYVAREAQSFTSMDKLIVGVQGGSVAAVLWEPPRFDPIDLKALRALREACTKQGTALITDEVVYGFRWATAGSRRITGVVPDISCFSKALGNGYAVGCMVGTDAWMDGASEMVSSTFGGEMIGLAAANAVLGVHKNQDVTSELSEIGNVLWAELDNRLANTAIERVGAHEFHWKFAPRYDVDNGEERFNLFLNACLKEGLLVHRSACNVNVCMAGLENDIAGRVEVAAKKASR